jgi:Tfp pilus assembly protein PilF
MTQKRLDRPGNDGGASSALVPALLVGMITFVVFAPTIMFEFTSWDDGINVYENPYLNPVTGRKLLQLWTTPYQRLYVPLVYTSFAIDTALWGMKPAAFHFTNVVLHSLSAVVVFHLLRRLLGGVGPALVGALLFALHPLQAEPVSWITGRKDVLCGLLGLVAIQQYTCWAKTDRIAAYLVASLGFVLALTAKPAAVAVPVMALVIDRWLLHSPLRRSLLAVLPWLVVAGIWTSITMGAQPPGEFADPPVPFWQRPFVASDALVFYMSKLFVPFGLVAVYDRTPWNMLGEVWTYTTPLVPTALALVLWRRSASLRTGGLVFLVGLLPVAGFIRFTYQEYSTVADRYMYLSMLGIALAGGYVYEKSVVKASPRRAGTVKLVAALVLMVLAALTFIQQRNWHDSESLWLHNLKWKPDCPLANYNLAKLYSDRDLPEKAVPYYQNAVKIKPNYMKARHNLGNDLFRLGLRAEQEGRKEKADLLYREALEQFDYQLRTNPKVSSVYYNASLIYSQLGDVARAEELLRKAVQYPPPLADAHVNLGNILGNRGDYDGAEKHYLEALRLNPNHPQASGNLRTVRQLRAARQRRP